eukprot:4277263-Prymnesium_polylepis.2
MALAAVLPEYIPARVACRANCRLRQGWSSQPGEAREPHLVLCERRAGGRRGNGALHPPMEVLRIVRPRDAARELHRISTSDGRFLG